MGIIATVSEVSKIIGEIQTYRELLTGNLADEDWEHLYALLTELNDKLDDINNKGMMKKNTYVNLESTVFHVVQNIDLADPEKRREYKIFKGFEDTFIPGWEEYVEDELPTLIKIKGIHHRVK